MGHGAIGVLLGDFLKGSLSWSIGKGVKQGDRALKGWLHLRLAGGGEADFTELFRNAVVVQFLREGTGDEQKAR
jgi:hypothetical protein